MVITNKTRVERIGLKIIIINYNDNTINKYLEKVEQALPDCARRAPLSFR